MASDDELEVLGAVADDDTCLEQAGSCDEASQGSDDDIELECTGCGISSSSMCPISKKRGRPHRVPWGKTTTRRRVKKGKQIRKVKVICGQWCRNCMNVYKMHFEKKWKIKAKQLAGILEKPEKKKAWDCAVAEYIHIKGGGTSRVAQLRKIVKKKHEAVEEIEDPDRVFVEISAYRKEYGDPKANKARIVSKITKSGKSISGVIVQIGKEGHYPLRSFARTSVANETEIEDGNLVLEAGQEEEAFSEQVQETFAESSSGILSQSETMRRAEAARAAKEAKEAKDAAGQKGQKGQVPNDSSDDEGSSSGSGSDSDDGSQEDCSDNEHETNKKAASSSRSVVSAKSGSSKRSCRSEPSSSKKYKASSPSQPISAACNTQERLALRRLLDTLESIVNNFTSGSYDSVTGRNLQRILRDWKEHMPSQKAALAAAEKSTDLADKVLAERIQSTNEAVNKIGNFLKMFNSGGKGALSSMIGAWSAVAPCAKPSVAKAKVLAKKSIEHALGAGDLADAALPLLDTKDPNIGKYGCKLISDSGMRESFSKELLEHMLLHLFTFNVDKRDSASVESARQRIEQSLQSLLQRMNKYELPAGVVDMISKVSSVLSAEDGGENATRLSEALSFWDSAGASMQKVFKSPVGLNAYKIASELKAAKSADALLQKELEDFKSTCEKLAMTEATELSGCMLRPLGAGDQLQTFKQAKGLLVQLPQFASRMTDGRRENMHKPLTDSTLAIFQYFDCARIALFTCMFQAISFDEMSKCTVHQDFECLVAHLDEFQSLWEKYVEFARSLPISYPRDLSVFAFAEVSKLLVRTSSPNGIFKDGFSMQPLQTCITFGLEVAEVRAKNHIATIKSCVETDSHIFDDEGKERFAGFAKNVEACIVSVQAEAAAYMVQAHAASDSGTLPVTREDFVDFVDAAGTLNETLLTKIRSLEVASTISRYDNLAGNLKVLNQLGVGNSETEGLESTCRIIMSGIPLLKSISEVHFASELFLQTRKEEEESNFRNKLSLVIRDFFNLEAKLPGDDFARVRANLKVWQAKVIQVGAECLGRSSSEVAAVVDSMDQYLVDLKECLLKDMSEGRLQKFMDLPGRVELRDGVKDLTNDTKRLESWLTVLKGTSLPISDHQKTLKVGVEARDKARLQVAVRAGVSILQAGDASKVEGYLRSCKEKVKVTVPKALAAALAAL